MTLLGFGLNFLIAIFFAVHVVRSGQPIFWLFVLFSFPLLGSLVYFVAVWLPSSRMDRGLSRASAAAVGALDPGRSLREAQRALDLSPTAQNQMRLAAALLEAGRTEEAIAQYDACLQGPFANDPEVLFGAAHARLQNREFAAAAAALASIRARSPDYKPEQVALLLAQAHVGTGDTEQARRELDAALARFGSMEVKVEYALFALAVGDRAKAEELRADIEASMKHWNQHTRSYNRPLVRRLEAGFAANRS